VAVCSQLADIILVLDQSTSIVTEDYDNWYVEVLNFAVDFASSFHIGRDQTQIGVLKFSDVLDIGFYLDDYDNGTAVIEAIQRLEIKGGDTNIAAALNQTRNEMFSLAHGARKGVSKVLFLVTDGTPNINGHLTVPQAKATKDSGIEIFAIGVTAKVNRQLLQQIVSKPNALHVYFVNLFSDLSSIVPKLVDVSCGTMPRSAVSTTTTTTTTTSSTSTTTTTTTTTTPVPTTTAIPGEFNQSSPAR